MIVTAILVAGLILPILFTVVLASLHSGNALPFDRVPLTLDNYQTLFGDPFTWRLLRNTVIYALASLAVAAALTIPLVWLVERTDLPMKSFISALVYVPLLIPSALTTMGWVQLLSPQTGFINVALRDWFGLGSSGGGGPLNVYSFTGMVLITGIDIVPSMFLMLSAAFKNMDAELEEAGRASGAGSIRVSRHVTLPLMLPSLSAAGIYYFILLIEFFEVPLVLGPNAHFQVLSTYVFQLVQPDIFLPEYGQAATFGTMAVAVGVVLVALYSRVSRKAYRYAVVRGQRQARGVVRLGRWRHVAFGAIGLFMLVSTVLPILALIWTSLFPTFTPVSGHAFGEISLGVYRDVFDDPRWTKAVVNTILVVVSACLTTTIIGTLTSWVVVRGSVGWTRWLDALAFLPRAIPNVVTAVGVFLITIRTPLYATVIAIVIGHTIAYLPYVVRLLSSTLLQIDRELEDAGRASGARTATVMLRIVLPLLRPAVVNVVLWVAAHSLRDFTFTLILGSASNTVVSLLLWQAWSSGNEAWTSAMAVMIVLVVLIIALPARYRLGKGVPT